MDGGLFEAEADAGGGMVLAQFPQPFPEGFGRGGDDRAAPLAGAEVDEAEVRFLVGSIPADDEVIGSRNHVLPFVVCWRASRRLDPATAI